MKTNHLFFYLLPISFLLLLCSCNPCHKGNLHLNSTKNWFPLKNQTRLDFLDGAGNMTTFSLKVIDTTETTINQNCGTTYSYDFINTTLYLNQAMTDSIFFTLGSAGWLCMQAYSNNNPNMTICNIFGEAKDGIIAKSLSHYSIGNKTYDDAILIFHNQGYSDSIDSVYIADHAGIVGFNYYGKNYTLK